MSSDCHIRDKSVNASYPIVKEYCNDRDLGVTSNVQMNGDFQTGISLSFPSFKFVHTQETEKVKMGLECSVR